MSWWVFVVHMPGGWQCSCSVVPGCLASVKYLPRGFDYPPANNIEPSAGLIFDLLWVRSPIVGCNAITACSFTRHNIM